MCKCVVHGGGEAQTHGLQDFPDPLTKHTLKRHCSDVNARDTGSLPTEIGCYFHACRRREGRGEEGEGGGKENKERGSGRVERRDGIG